MLSYRRFAWFTLAFCVGVILWGAYVRATGSGAGCGSHWPLCNGEVVPREARSQTMIEYSHRLTSGISLLLVMALWIWSLRIFPKGSFHRKSAGLAFVAIVLEAAIGAGLVLLRLVEHDQSVDRAISIALHLVNTLFLLACLTVVARATEESTPRWKLPPSRERNWTRALLLGFALLGALGALTALGDTLFPVGRAIEAVQGELGRRHFLEQIRIFHPIAAVAWFGLLWAWAFSFMERFPENARAAKLPLYFAAANLALGLLNVLMRAPVGIQILHLLLADLLWISLVSAVFSAASRWR